MTVLRAMVLGWVLLVGGLILQAAARSAVGGVLAIVGVLLLAGALVAARARKPRRRR